MTDHESSARGCSDPAAPVGRSYGWRLPYRPGRADGTGPVTAGAPLLRPSLRQ